MAETVSPFSHATVEISEEFLNSFPKLFHILPYLHKLFCHMSVEEILSSEKPISVRSNWTTVMKLEEVLKTVLSTLKEAVGKENNISSEEVMKAVFGPYLNDDGSGLESKLDSSNSSRAMSEFLKDKLNEGTLTNQSQNFVQISGVVEEKVTHSQSIQKVGAKNKVSIQDCGEKININKEKKCGYIFARPISLHAHPLIPPEPIVICEELLCSENFGASKSEVEAALREVCSDKNRTQKPSQQSKKVNSIDSGVCSVGPRKRRKIQNNLNSSRSSNEDSCEFRSKSPKSFQIEISSNICPAFKEFDSHKYEQETNHDNDSKQTDKIVKRSAQHQRQRKKTLRERKKVSVRGKGLESEKLKSVGKFVGDKVSYDLKCRESLNTPDARQNKDITLWSNKLPSPHKQGSNIQRDLKCLDCGKIFNFTKDLRAHLKTHQQPQYCCETCGGLYKDERYLKVHMAVHDPDYVKPVFPCKFCDRSFSSKYVLARHLKRQHLGIQQSFVCPICGSSFTQKHVYITHALSHADLKPYVCDTCGKGFTCEKSLCQHKLLHSEEKKFVCKICNKAFKQSSGLSTHQRIHKDTKDRMCHVCGRGFNQMQSLLRHERTHTGEKPYECLLCHQRVRDQSTMRRHIVRTHMKTDWKSYTKRHLKQPSLSNITTNAGSGKRNDTSVKTSVEDQRALANSQDKEMVVTEAALKWSLVSPDTMDVGKSVAQEFLGSPQVYCTVSASIMQGASVEPKPEKSISEKSVIQETSANTQVYDMASVGALIKETKDDENKVSKPIVDVDFTSRPHLHEMAIEKSNSPVVQSATKPRFYEIMKNGSAMHQSSAQSQTKEKSGVKQSVSHIPEITVLDSFSQGVLKSPKILGIPISESVPVESVTQSVSPQEYEIIVGETVEVESSQVPPVMSNSADQLSLSSQEGRSDTYRLLMTNISETPFGPKTTRQYAGSRLTVNYSNACTAQSSMFTQSWIPQQKVTSQTVSQERAMSATLQSTPHTQGNR